MGRAHALPRLLRTHPRLAYLSPEPGSGKTRALEILELLTPNPLHAVNATPAHLFRKIADTDNRPTILFDEADTDTMLEDLVGLDESPWADLRGKPLDARGLSRRLREYVTTDGQPIKPTVIRIGDFTPRGYRRADLADAWSRYLPPTPQGSATSATAATPDDVPVEDPPSLYFDEWAS